MFSVIKLILLILKELIFVNFTPESQIVKSYVLLIVAGIMSFDDVPDVGNLREVVQQVLTS